MGAAALPLRNLLLQLGAVVIILMSLRWIFFWANSGHFPSITAWDAFLISVQGLRFDAMTVVAVNALFILLSLLPIPARSSQWYRRSLFVIFISLNAVMLLICCIDLAYFGFTGKRITRDVLGMAGPGLRQMPAFMLRFWWVTLSYAGAIALLVFVWRRTERVSNSIAGIRQQLIVIVPAMAVLSLIGRGGLQEHGLAPAHAANHVRVALSPLVTNSAFTLGFSFTMPPLPLRDYMPAEEMDRLAPLAYELRRDSTDRPWNVVLLVVESMGREYLSSISGEAAYMPFMDSLCQQSLVFTNAFANAESSSKGLCALVAGVPSFTDDPFMGTAYADNEIEGMASRLRDLGYSTAFMHGGINGELRLNSFAMASGYHEYLGKDEFNDDSHFDGHWGIFDEEFLQWSVERMAAMPQPFHATVFTLSSHHPYTVPKRYTGRFPKGTQEIHESLGYTDLALRRFFERIAKEPFYRNTLFLITADHTYQWGDHPVLYRSSVGRFAVPIILHAGDSSFVGRNSTVAQQLDAVPTVLDLVGYEGRIGTVGRSLMRDHKKGAAITHLNNLFQLIEEDRVLLFDGEQSKGLFDYKTDTLLAQDLSAVEPEVAERLTMRAKALIQRHADMLRNNRHRPER